MLITRLLWGGVLGWPFWGGRERLRGGFRIVRGVFRGSSEGQRHVITSTQTLLQSKEQDPLLSSYLQNPTCNMAIWAHTSSGLLPLPLPSSKAGPPRLSNSSAPAIVLQTKVEQSLSVSTFSPSLPFSSVIEIRLLSLSMLLIL